MKAFVTSLIVISLFGCAVPPAIKDSAGFYSVTHQSGNFEGSLELRNDSTYTMHWRHLTHKADGGVIDFEDTESGRWKVSEGSVEFFDNRAEESEITGQQCWLWGRYRIEGNSLLPEDSKAGPIELKRVRKLPNLTLETTAAPLPFPSFTSSAYSPQTYILAHPRLS